MRVSSSERGSTTSSVVVALGVMSLPVKTPPSVSSNPAVGSLDSEATPRDAMLVVETELSS